MTITTRTLRPYELTRFHVGLLTLPGHDPQMVVDLTYRDQDGADQRLALHIPLGFAAALCAELVRVGTKVRDGGFRVKYAFEMTRIRNEMRNRHGSSYHA